MKASLENLQKIGAELYQAAQAAGAAPGGDAGAGPGPEASAGAAGGSSGSSKKEKKVVDADFEVVDEDKK
jgi:molecular chaperone DnaK